MLRFFGGARTCSRSSITMPSLVGLGFHRRRGGQKRWVFLCLFVTGNIPQRNVPVFKLLRGRFWGFSPRRGDKLHRWGWNLARRRGPNVPSFMPNFTPIWVKISIFGVLHPCRCTDEGEISMPNFTPIGASCRPCGAKNLKIGLWVN